MTSSQEAYEVRPRKDKRGVVLISDVLPFGRLWYGEPNAPIKSGLTLSIRPSAPQSMLTSRSTPRTGNPEFAGRLLFS
jgi:hypothetical protein